jgi:hypothetical protein
MGEYMITADGAVKNMIFHLTAETLSFASVSISG